MTRRGRSTLLDIDLPAPVRERNRPLRWLLTVLVTTAVVAIAITVAREFLPMSGAASLLYWLHDALWVPFWAHVWVQNGVGSLIWFAPAAAFAALALTEYLGLAQPVRSLQATALRLALRTGSGRWVLMLQQRLGWCHGFEAFLVRVIDSDLIRARLAAMEALEQGRGGNANRLGRAMIQRAYLRAGEETGRIACAEALCLMIALGLSSDARERWERALARVLGPGALPDLRLALHPAGEKIERPLDSLADPACPPQRLALLTLAHAGGHAALAPGRVRAWFDLWAEIARESDAASGRLAAAEILIDFEFWAARAEAALVVSEGSGDRAGWLAALLPDVPMSRPLGELESVGLDRRAGMTTT